MADYDKDIPEDESDRGAMTEEQQASSDAMKPKAAAPRVVSKAELDKSGLSLRDFLNKERGLTRRGGEAPAPAAPVRANANFSNEGRSTPKPPLRQETMQDRASSYVAKQAARKAEEAAADAASDKNRQARIAVGIRKNAGANLGMGNTGLKKGGSVSSASRRADGIATKGKTRGKMC
jgi:hypothetical protein